MSLLDLARGARDFSAVNRGDRTPNPSDTVGVLVGRLNTGWLMIEAEPNPTKRERLEDHWIILLHDYEEACDPDNPEFSDPIKRGSTP